MGTAETDIDALQASDAQQTGKISALEADMNNVKPRVGQLESDVGTLGTKVDQHTQSISGLSTEVNGLKTSKQDKLTAGENIKIENNVISASGRSYRNVSGSSNIEEELRFFFGSSKPDDSIRIVLPSTSTGMQGCLEMKYIIKFGWTHRDSSGREGYVYISPEDEIRHVGFIDGTPIYRCEKAQLESKKVGSSADTAKVGVVYIRKLSNGVFVFSLLDSSNSFSFRNYSTDVFKMSDTPSIAPSTVAIVNYNRN